MQIKHKTEHWLAYLGLLPFFLGLYLMYFPQSFVTISGWMIFSVYSGVILSFLSGSLWGSVSPTQSDAFGSFVLILSNLLALVAWFALLWPARTISLSLLAIGYFVLWQAEWFFCRAKVINLSKDYLKMRRNLTVIVILLHLCVLYL